MAKANELVGVIQKYLGINQSTTWNAQTNLEFTTKLRELQKQLGINPTGNFGEKTLKAFEKAIKEGKIDKEFGQAVIGLYKGGVDSNGQDVKLSSLHSSKLADQTPRPVEKPREPEAPAAAAPSITRLEAREEPVKLQSSADIAAKPAGIIPVPPLDQAGDLIVTSEVARAKPDAGLYDPINKAALNQSFNVEANPPVLRSTMPDGPWKDTATPPRQASSTPDNVNPATVSQDFGARPGSLTSRFLDISGIVKQGAADLSQKTPIEFQKNSPFMDMIQVRIPDPTATDKMNFYSSFMNDYDKGKGLSIRDGLIILAKLGSDEPKKVNLNTVHQNADAFAKATGIDVDQKFDMHSPTQLAEVITNVASIMNGARPAEMDAAWGKEITAAARTANHLSAEPEPAAPPVPAVRRAELTGPGS